MAKAARGGVALLSLAVLLSCLISPVQAHEQETFTVILNGTDVSPGDIADEKFLEGSALWFRMFDDTENATMQVSIDLDQDGLYNGTGDNVSVWLVDTCPLDEEGNMTDPDCAKSHLYRFSNSSAGNYTFQITRMVNNTTTNVWTHNITVFKDVHVEPGQPGIGDSFGIGGEEEEEPVESEDTSLDTDKILRAILAVAIVASIGLIISILGDNKHTGDSLGSLAAVQDEEE